MAANSEGLATALRESAIYMMANNLHTDFDRAVVMVGILNDYGWKLVRMSGSEQERRRATIRYGSARR